MKTSIVNARLVHCYLSGFYWLQPEESTLTVKETYLMATSFIFVLLPEKLTLEKATNAPLLLFNIGFGLSLLFVIHHFPIPAYLKVG